LHADVGADRAGGPYGRHQDRGRDEDRHPRERQPDQGLIFRAAVEQGRRDHPGREPAGGADQQREAERGQHGQRHQAGRVAGRAERAAGKGPHQAGVRAEAAQRAGDADQADDAEERAGAVRAEDPDHDGGEHEAAGAVDGGAEQADRAAAGAAADLR
jgi:hypothetical protein